MEPILKIENLHITFSTYGGTVKAVRGVDFYLNPGETLAIVGESGCGKSVTSNAIMQLIPRLPVKITNRKILYKGKDLTMLTEQEMRKSRGVDISMIFQDPMTALNPTLTIGTQLIEGLLQHTKLSRSKAKKRSEERRVGKKGKTRRK